MNETPPIRPSAWYYCLALPFLALGVSIFVHTLWHGLHNITASLTQVVMPGEINLDLAGGKIYTVFYEQQSVMDGKIYSSHENLNGLQCQLNPLDQGNAVPLRRPNTSTHYGINGRSGTSVLEFSIAHDGQYHFACDYAAPSARTEVVFAIGSGLGHAFLKMILTSFTALFGGGALAVLAFFGVYILRDNAKARAAAARQVFA